MNTTNVLEAVARTVDGSDTRKTTQLTVDPSTKEGRDERVHDNVGNIEESHYGTESRDVLVLGLHPGERRLDVSSERHVTSSPTVRDRDEDGGELPGGTDIATGVGEERHHPDEVEQQSIQTQPGHGGGDGLGEDHDREGTEQFTKVGTADDDLRIGRNTNDGTGVDGSKTVLEVSVTVKGKGISGNKPDESAVGEDEVTSVPEGLDEGANTVDHRHEDTTGLNLDAGKARLLLIALALTERGDPDPYGGGEGEEDGREESRVVVAKLADERGRGEGTSGTGNLVHDVDESVHLSQTVDITTNNVTRNHTADQLDSAVRDSRDDVDREETIWAPATVLGLVVSGLVLEHTARGSVGNERNSSDDTKSKNGSSEYRTSRETLDQGSDNDGADALGGVVGTGQDGDLLETTSTETLISLGDKASVEVLKSKLITHDSQDINADVATLFGREGAPEL